MLNCKRYSQLIYQIIGAAMEVHSVMGKGLLEAVYQEALHLELRDRGIESIREQELSVFYKEHLLDKRYRLDLLVGDIIVELKSARELVPAYRAQLCNYLRLTHKPVGLLINFGEDSLIGERWAYDSETNDCYLVDKNMEPVYDADYEILFGNDDDY